MMHALRKTSENSCRDWGDHGLPWPTRGGCCETFVFKAPLEKLHKIHGRIWPLDLCFDESGVGGMEGI